jgi:hypothetical protein
VVIEVEKLALLVLLPDGVRSSRIGLLIRRSTAESSSGPQPKPCTERKNVERKEFAIAEARQTKGDRRTDREGEIKL